MLKLFKRKPRLDAPEPEERRTALAALDAGAQDDFERLCRTDPDTSVRLAALARLTRVDALAATLDDAAVAGEAAKRLLALTDAGGADSLRDHPAVRRAAVAAAETAEAAAQAAAGIEDAAERAAALLAHPRASIRLAAADTIWEPAVLAALEKGARGADSATHRLARERAALHRSAMANRDGENAHAEEVLAAAITLAHADPHYQARYTALERKWRDAIAAIRATDETLARFGVVARDVEALGARFPARHAVEKAPQVDVQAFGDLVTQAEALGATVADIIAGASAGAEPFEAALRQLRDAKRQADALAARWNVLTDAQPADDALRQRFDAARADVAARAHPFERAATLAEAAAKTLAEALPDASDAATEERKRALSRQRAAVARLIERYAWPDEVAAPSPLTALLEKQTAIENALAQCEVEAAEHAEEAGRALATLRECVERGAAAQAVAQERRVRNLLDTLTRQHAHALRAELAAVSGAVRELNEWRLYAETPKREGLCREMEALAEKPLPATAQIEAVRALRERWKALGGANMGRHRALHKRFEAAAEQAFAPCRAHFKAEAERRRFNLEQRQAIVAALENFLDNNDWEHAHWRGVERILRQARADWRSYHPVDRKAERAIKSRFEALAQRIHGLLKEAWAKHEQAKEAIVAEAAKVRASGDQASAKADAMKGLQRRWKQVGPVPRGADQRLWKRFRAECDAVFEQRTDAMGRHHERRAAIDEAEAIISELARRVDLDASLDRNAVADYAARLDALGSLPKDLRRRADTAIDDADRAVVQSQRGG